jgi:hypothetical protein
MLRMRSPDEGVVLTFNRTAAKDVDMPQQRVNVAPAAAKPLIEGAHHSQDPLLQPLDVAAIVQAPAAEDSEGLVDFQRLLAQQQEVKVLKPDLVLYQQAILLPRQDHYSSPAYDFNCTWYQVIYDTSNGAASLKDTGGAASRPCHDVFADEGIQLPSAPGDIDGAEEIVIIKYKDHRLVQRGSKEHSAASAVIADAEAPEELASNAQLCMDLPAWLLKLNLNLTVS